MAVTMCLYICPPCVSILRRYCPHLHICPPSFHVHSPHVFNLHVCPFPSRIHSPHMSILHRAPSCIYLSSMCAQLPKVNTLPSNLPYGLLPHISILSKCLFSACVYHLLNVHESTFCREQGKSWVNVWDEVELTTPPFVVYFLLTPNVVSLIMWGYLKLYPHISWANPWKKKALSLNINGW